MAVRLGNTPTICRKCYIHPEVLNSYLNGNLTLRVTRQVKTELSNGLDGLRPEEAAVLALLRSPLMQTQAH